MLMSYLFLQGKNRLFVHCVANHVLHMFLGQFTCELTQGKSHTNVQGATVHLQVCFVEYMITGYCVTAVIQFVSTSFLLAYS